ncbi:porin family protein [Pseudaminobacter sp. 19-2017]|uniref:Porin family protein n=1 Tax=Pseudaminobacter soli (ex Zhang et al. 2022) TaxID=2831468 RepID=A0A942DW00_9HYPH|nr:outer membrane protein [Pseudaminobacter soli]MBS3647923.1 porin family protein [Pseudaminobacter soli]
MRGLAAVLASGIAFPAVAADFFEPPPVVEAPPPVYQAPAVGGWYIRGDVDYHWNDFSHADYITGTPGAEGRLNGDLKGAMSIGAGIGYQVNDYFRVDFTGDYFFDADFDGSTVGFCGGGAPCVSSDSTSMNALLLLANAYVDLGTYYGFTPYVGAGIGGAHVRWDDLRNVNDDGEFFHEGGKEWRFAYAAMAGVSYCLTSATKLDVGYRFSHINGGRMFGFDTGAGPGFDDGINVHEVRGGLRYQFTGNNGCEPPPPPVAYEPPPVYKQ